MEARFGEAFRLIGKMPAGIRSELAAAVLSRQI
jgi:hypothetical protein